MGFRTNLMRARSHIVMVLGLVIASIIIVTIELSDLPGDEASDYQWSSARPLSPAEMEAAAHAWNRLRARDPRRARAYRRKAESLGIIGAPDRPLSPAASAAILDAMIEQRRAGAVASSSARRAPAD